MTMIEAFCLHTRFHHPELTPTRVSDHQEGNSGLVGNRPVAVMQCHSVVRLVVRASEAGNAGPYTATLYYPLVPRPHWRFRTIGCPATARNRHCGQASLLAQPEIGTVWT